MKLVLGLLVMAAVNACVAPVSTDLLDPDAPRVVIHYDEEWALPLGIEPSWSADDLHQVGRIMYELLETREWRVRRLPVFVLVRPIREENWTQYGRDNWIAYAETDNDRIYVREWSWRVASPYDMCHEFAHLEGAYGHPAEVFDLNDYRSLVNICADRVMARGLAQDVWDAVERGDIARRPRED